MFDEISHTSIIRLDYNKRKYLQSISTGIFFKAGKSLIQWVHHTP